MWKRRNITVILIALTIGAAAVIFGHPQTAAAAAPTPTLAGSWRVTQCPGTTDEFFVLTSFSEGGTAFAADQSAGVGSKGVGVWTKISGSLNAATFEEFMDGDNDGSSDSRLRFRSTAQLTGPQTFTGTITVDVLSLDGSTLLEVLGSCAIEGTRLTVVRE